jgi:hypothetical protein
MVDGDEGHLGDQSKERHAASHIYQERTVLALTSARTDRIRTIEANPPSQWARCVKSVKLD